MIYNGEIKRRYVPKMKHSYNERKKAKAIAISRQQLDARLRFATTVAATLLLSLLLLGAGRLIGP